MKISIIIPAHNEEKRIEKTLEEYGKFFKEKKNKNFDFEIVVVINNTRDRTEEIVKKYSKIYKEIRYLNFERWGKGFAIIEGFKDALKRKNDLIGFVDADMSTSPFYFYEIIKNIGLKDGIIASRWMKSARAKRTLTKKMTSSIFNFVVRSLFLFPYSDTQCGAKLFKREVAEKILPDLDLTEWAFDINLLYLCSKHHFKIREYPTVWIDKEGSKIQNIPKVSIQMFLGVVRLRLMNSFLEPLLRPVKFLLIVGDRLINKI